MKKKKSESFAGIIESKVIIEITQGDNVDEIGKFIKGIWIDLPEAVIEIKPVKEKSKVLLELFSTGKITPNQMLKMLGQPLIDSSIHPSSDQLFVKK